jgi:hypothetical protein
MSKDDEERVLRYMKTSGQKRAVIKMRGRFYLCEVKEELTAWENQPYDVLRETEIPEPIELPT